jgi:hypothetical protein
MARSREGRLIGREWSCNGVASLPNGLQPHDADFFYLSYTSHTKERDVSSWQRLSDRPSGRSVIFEYRSRTSRGPVRHIAISYWSHGTAFRSPDLSLLGSPRRQFGRESNVHHQKPKISPMAQWFQTGLVLELGGMIALRDEPIF